MSDLVDGLRERADWADYYTDAEFLRRAASHIEAQEKRIVELKEHLKFIERWAVYKTGPAEERLSVIAHYPPISAISKTYSKATLSQKEENE